MGLEWRLSLTVTCEDCKTTETFAREHGQFDPICIAAVERDAFGGLRTGWVLIHSAAYCRRCKWNHARRPHGNRPNAAPACPNFPGACECLPEELIWNP